MPKTLQAEFSKDGIHKLIKDLEVYRDSLDDKCDELVMNLAKGASETAEGIVGGSEYGSHISFGVEKEKKGSALIKGTNKSMVVRHWMNNDGRQSAEVNPLLMAEFGSGFKAIEPEWSSAKGLGGQGTFPNQKYAFGTDFFGYHQDEWGWTELDGTHMRSSGEYPMRPMHFASTYIMYKYLTEAKKVFKK